ncbi:MAG: membrane protease subunit HflK [Myxococcota bacterium]
MAEPPVIDFQKFRNVPGGPNRFRFLGFVALALVVLGVGATTFFTVEPEEEGVVLRFGEFDRTVAPGLHFKLPSPIEVVWKVPTQRQLKEEFGFRTTKADVRSEYTNKGLDDEKLMLTGDLNVAVVEWIAQYRVKDPYKYLFKVRNVRSTFRDMNEAVMRQIVGDRSVTEVLTIGRQDIEVEAQRLLQEWCDEYETGIQVEQVVLQNVTPPDKVKPSFDEVNQAQQERERLINEAKTGFNTVIPAARGQAEEMIAQAQGYAVQRTNRAEGEAGRFTALLEAYKESPEVTRKRIYLETMAEVYPKAKRKILMSKGAGGVLPFLDLQGGD